MRRFKKGFVRNICIGLIVVLGAGIIFISLAQAQTTITILRPRTPEKVKKFLEPALEEFQAKYPDIRVEPMYLGWMGWISKAPAMWGAGDQPDVVLWWDFRQSEELVRYKLVPLEEYVDPQVIEKNVFANLAKLRGKLYLLPISIGSMTLMWRKDVFAEAGLEPNRPPQTFDELLQYCKKIKTNTDVFPIGVQAKKDENLQEYVSYFYYPIAGKSWLDEKNQPIFNTEEGVKALQTFKSLKPYAQPGAIETSRGDLRPLIRDGKVAMHYDGPWIIPMLQQRFGENLDESPIGIGLMPGTYGDNPGWIGIDGWVITRKEKAEAAGKLISFLSSPEQQYRHDSIYGQVPVYLEELEKPVFRFNFWKTFVEAGKGALPRPGYYHPRPYGIYRTLIETWQKVWLDVLSPKKALEEAEKEIRKFNERLGI